MSTAPGVMSLDGGTARRARVTSGCRAAGKAIRWVADAEVLPAGVMVPATKGAAMEMAVRVGTEGKRCKHWYSSCICRSMGTRELHTSPRIDQAEAVLEVMSS